jgi:hypothetical protein
MKILLATVFLLGLAGCGPSTEEKQHHLYNIEQCKAEATKFFDEIDWNDPNFKGLDPQGAFQGHMVKCMADAERTTTDFQYDKHDDYGKLQLKK